MPIVIVATPGASDANSYADLAEADAFAETRIGAQAAAWFASTDTDAKARALITATRDIDSIPSLEVDFYGARATDTQSLEFPRDSDGGVLPQRLIDATIELAIIYLANPAASDPLNPSFNDKKKVQSGDDSVEWFAPPKEDIALSITRFPAIVQRLLGPLLVWLTVSNWGSGTAIRVS